MIARIINPLRYFNTQARLFFAVLLSMGFVVDGVYTVLLNLYLLRLGYGTEFIGLVNAVGLFAFAITSLPAGILGSRLSNTRLMKIGAGSSLIGGLFLPLVELLPPGWREAWLVIHYALMLAGFSLFFVNGAPFLINIVDSRYKNHAFAIKTAHWALAGFIGALVGGIMPELVATNIGLTLDDPAPYRITLMMASAVLCLSLLLVLNIRPLPGDSTQIAAGTTSETIPQRRVHWTMPLITIMAIMTFIRLFQVAGSATVLVFFNVYMDRQLAVSTGTIGIIAAIGRLIGVPTALIVPSLVRRWGNANVVIWSSLAASLCLLPLALVEHWLPAAIGFIGTVSLMSIRYTAFIVYILDLVPKVQQSVMAGTGEMAAGFSFAIMALGGGMMLSLFSFRDLFLLGAALSVIGTITFWWHCRKANVKHKLAPV